MGILLNPDLESRIAAKVQSGRYSSADEVVDEGLSLLEARDAGAEPAKPIDGASMAEMIAEIAAQVPDEEWSRLPTDLSRNIDHYLYGSPRRSE